MAGFDLAAQHGGQITGFGMIEGGYFDFSAGSQTADVPTRMSYAYMGFGVTRNNDVNSDVVDSLIATTDGDITNGVITFRRQGLQAADSRVYYTLTGF
ncbi:hypothetical protein LCGC14_0638290 [marine sediment metagenome]|uniref:Uncharacterized protein n=1 Tax=marine sediment metagenome TaxID=412755 RepID=A0A0F9U8D9_9ZZZZ